MAAATKKEKKRRSLYPWKTGASCGHITNLKQSILDFRYLWIKPQSFILPLVPNKLALFALPRTIFEAKEFSKLVNGRSYFLTFLYNIECISEKVDRLHSTVS